MGELSKSLQSIVDEMVQENKPASKMLSRGLALGFRPQVGEDVKAGARFVWSRKLPDHPSEQEDKIVIKVVNKSLRSVKSKVVVGGPSFRTGIILRSGWGSSMLYWKWISTTNLMSLRGSERDRAMEWIEG